MLFLLYIFIFYVYAVIVHNIETTFDGRVNISVVCMAPRTDVFILCAIYIKHFKNFIFFQIRIYFAIFELINCNVYLTKGAALNKTEKPLFRGPTFTLRMRSCNAAPSVRDFVNYRQLY